MKDKKEQSYAPLFERITSSSMLHHAIAGAFGVPVNKLGTMLSLKDIKLDSGPGVEVMILNPAD